MAKPILGDDPFGSAPRKLAAGKKPPVTAKAKAAPVKKKPDAVKKKAAPVKTKAAPVEKKAAPVEKKAAPVEKKARAVENTPSVVEPKESAPVGEKRAPVEEKTTHVAPAPANAGAASPAASHIAPPPPTPPTQAPSEYGPSIDRPAPSAARRIVEEVRGLEHEVRQRLLPQRPTDTRRLPLEFLWRRWSALAMRDRSDVVDEFGRDPRVSEQLAPWLEFFYKTYFRVDVRGMGHIPDDGRALIVANHSGTLPWDGAMIMHAVQRDHASHRDVRPLAEDFVFHFPYLGTLMNRIGAVRACQENAQRLLEQDQLVAVFPEGIKGLGKRYKERYQLQRFGRGGFIKLALATDSPIIPTAVVGAEEIHPMLAKVTFLAKALRLPYIPLTPTFPWLGPIGLVPLPSKWYIAFGPPLYFNAEYGADGAHDRILVNKLAEQVRQRIQEMVDAMLRERRSVIFG